jgi:hypothetical protein
MNVFVIALENADLTGRLQLRMVLIRYSALHC